MDEPEGSSSDVDRLGVWLLGPIAALAALLANPLGGWQPNNPEAMALYEDTEQLRRKTEMKELLKKQEQ